TGTNAAAIDMRYTSSTVNGNGSVIEGNVVIPDATGNVKYGYADVAGTSGVSLIGNSFWGTIGPYVLAGTTSSTFGSIFYSGSGFWQNVDIAAPGGSASKQILTGTGTLVVSPTSSGYTWNVTMPAGASQGQPVTIVFDKAMTTTFAGSGSDTVVNPITSVVAGQRVTLTYSGTAWH
ncbi:MAG TPA: hypothetical protein VFG62_10345, partial [Rhodopila sp.]|nr:hypothetical protein [Rhodopila sp.]